MFTVRKSSNFAVCWCYHQKELFFLAATPPSISLLYSCQIIPHFMCQRLEHPVLFDSFSVVLAKITLPRWRYEDWRINTSLLFLRNCTEVWWLALSPEGKKVMGRILIGLFLCGLCSLHIVRVFFFSEHSSFLPQPKNMSHID